MIIQARTARLSYGADPVAANVRSFIAAPAARLAGYEAVGPVATAPRPLAELYPALFAARPQSLPVRAVRGLAFRLGVVGSVIVGLAALHH